LLLANDSHLLIAAIEIHQVTLSTSLADISSQARCMAEPSSN
jgi:hypothetical protein